MITQSEHEEAFVGAFVVIEKRDRYLSFLRNPKRRAEITRRFDHFFNFVPSLATRIGRGAANELALLLRNRGSGATAHVIGGDDDIDGREIALEDALDGALAAPGGTVVSCVPGQLALLVQEFPPGDTFILMKKKSEPNQPPQRNVGGRPSSIDSSASKLRRRSARVADLNRSAEER